MMSKLGLANTLWFDLALTWTPCDSTDPSSMVGGIKILDLQKVWMRQQKSPMANKFTTHFPYHLPNDENRCMQTMISDYQCPFGSE